MAIERTLTILKPDCVKKGLIGEVTKRIQEAGFTILAMKMTRLTPDTAGGFYAVHKERPFYDELCEFMSSGACVPMILEKENAIFDNRKFVCDQRDGKAAEGLRLGSARLSFQSSGRQNGDRGVGRMPWWSGQCL